MDLKEKIASIEDALDRLNKANTEDEVIEDQVVEDEAVEGEEKPYERVEEVDEETIEKSEETEEVEDEEDSEEEKEEGEIEKSVYEDEDGLIEDEVEEEDVEVGEDGYMEFDEVVRIVEETVMEKVQAEINNLRMDLEDVVSLIEKQTNVAENMQERIDTSEQGGGMIQKSLTDIGERLDRMATRKSVKSKSLYVKEKFQEEANIDTLSKAQKASILADALEAGNKKVDSEDVIKAELGGRISQGAMEVLAKAIR